jgi:hypothetical protein
LREGAFVNDRDLFALVRSTALPLIQAQAGLSAVAMTRKFQPRQQGAETEPVIYFVKIGPDHRHGSPRREDLYDGAGGVFGHMEKQLLESTFQFSAWIPQTPADTASLTESDVLNVVSAIMQSDAVIEAFRAAGVGVQRVTDIRNPYFVDERDRFEAEPSFDIVLTHYRNLSFTLPAVDTFEADVRRV